MRLDSRKQYSKVRGGAPCSGRMSMTLEELLDGSA